MMKKNEAMRQMGSLLAGLLILASIALAKHGSLPGHDFQATTATAHQADNDTLQVLDDGSMVVNTTSIASDIIGYAGTVPLLITIKDNRVEHIKALPNQETEDFFETAAVLLSRWNGKTTEEAEALQVDAVSGATFSSKAIIGNVQRGLAYARRAQATIAQPSFDWSVKNIAGILVVLMAAILPLFVKNKTYRFCQSTLNVVVLGLWCGSFLSYTSLMGYMAHGMNPLAVAVPCLMLLVALVYPLIGHKSYYCTHLCPFGSLQYMASRCVSYKVKMGARLVRGLDIFRKLLWCLLMILIWTGVWADWTDYEPFAAFIFQSASWVVIAIAIAFVLLSFVVVRPYCRFVCPMGTWLRICQSSKWRPF